MKLSLAVCAALATSAAAFAPAQSQRSTTALNSVDRRAAFGQIAAGAAVVALPQLALADGAVSAATVSRARFTYGGRIADLKSAVEKGDLEAVAAEKNAFILFNSGVYPTAKDKALKKAAIADTNAIFAAIRSGDKSALKTAYSKYVASNDIKPAPVVDASKGQGYSSEFDFKSRTKAGTIYVR